MSKKLALGALVVAAATANADIIDFQHLEFIGGGSVDVGESVTEDGWLIDKNPGEPFQFAVWGTQATQYQGSTMLFNNTIDGMNRLQHGAGAVFNLTSIDLADLNAGPGGQNVTVNFTGFINGGGTVLQSFTTDAVFGMETFVFSGFNNLTKVEWLQEASFHQYDNINVTVVPEPTVIVGLGLGLGLLVARRRK